MRRFALLTILLMAVCLLSAQDLQPWQYVRHSAVDNNGQVHVRFNGSPSILNAYEFYNWQNNAWNQVTLTNPETLVYEALLPAGTGQTLKYRLRTSYEAMGESITAVNPAFLSADTFPPALNALGYIADDPVGDSINVYFPNLDITGNWFGYTNTKLYCAMSNTANLFPAMNTFTSYNLYFAGLAATTSAAADSSVYAMIYTFNIPGVISPGLYRLGLNVTDTTVVYQYLGPIQSVVSGGKLFMSCNISDLTADPGFGTWPPDYNSLGFMSGSMRINIDLGTLTPSFGLGDLSGLAQLIFENHSYTIGQNALPVINYIDLEGMPDAAILKFQYYDANADFPLTCQGGLLGEDPVDFVPASLDFSQPVMMYLSQPVDISSAYEAHFFVNMSDNNIDFVYDGNFWVANDDETLPTPAVVKIYPNPYNPSKGMLHIDFSGRLTPPDRRIWIYNSKGQLIKLTKFSWDGTDSSGKPVGDGVYLLRHLDYEDMRGYKVQKIMVIR